MRQSAEFCNACEISNRTAMEHVKKTKKIYTYQCHAGLTEVIVPIMADSTVLCYLMIGQFLLVDAENSSVKLVNQDLAEWRRNSKIFPEND